PEYGGAVFPCTFSEASGFPLPQQLPGYFLPESALRRQFPVPQRFLSLVLHLFSSLHPAALSARFFLLLTYPFYVPIIFLLSSCSSLRPHSYIIFSQRLRFLPALPYYPR